MVREQLFIDGTEIDLLESLNPSFTYSIADISEPDKRKADFSRTITLPLSKAARKVFNHIFEINIDSTFDPNLKADTLYLVDSQTIFDGVIQVLKVVSNDENHLILEVSLTGKLKNIILEFGDKELDDSGMNWSDMNHTYNRTNQQASWTPTLGTDYVYPLIYHGADTNVQVWDVEDMFPAAFAKEYIDRMFADAGFSYTSTFFDSTFFKSLIIPYNGGGELKLSDSSISDRQFEYNTPLYDSTGTNSLKVPLTAGATKLVRFTNLVTDPTTQYNTSTGILTIGETGYYDFSTMFDLTAEFVVTGSVNDVYPNCAVEGQFFVFKNGTTFPTNLLGGKAFKIVRDELITPGSETTTGTTYEDTDYVKLPNDLALSYAGGTPEIKMIPVNAPLNSAVIDLEGRVYDPPKDYQHNLTDIYLEAGDQIQVHIAAVFTRLNDVDGQNNLWSGSSGYYIDSVDTNWETGYTGYANLVLGSGSFFKNKAKNVIINDGNTLNFQDAIPKKIKQKDFFMSIVKMFNLYVEPDNDNPRNLVIEPRVDFYNNTVKDWTEKLDISQDLEFYPMGALDAKEYVYSYKPDKDYYNDKYTKSWQGDTYGQREFEITNDFLKNEKRMEVMFSPTPTVGRSYLDYYIPHIISIDNQNQAKPVESNIRILYWGGLKDTQTLWNHTSQPAVTVDDWQTQYPYAGHFDDPITPTVDINFGLVRELYYDDTYQDLTWSDNNIFNIYHKDFINEITDSNSKIVKGWFYLTPLDIMNLSFRELYYFEGAYHRLHKVQDYKPAEVALTKCEFLKLANVTPFVKSSGSITGGANEAAGDEIIPLKSGSVQENRNTYDSLKHFVQGEGNIIDRSADNIKVQGDDNIIGAEAKNINISGSGNAIAPGVFNVTLVNTYNKSITDSNVTYIDGVAQSGDDVVVEKSTNFTTDIKNTTYEVDTSSSNITVTMTDDASEGKIFRIKKTSAANKITVVGGKGQTIEGQANLVINNLNTNVPLQFDGVSNWIIL